MSDVKKGDIVSRKSYNNDIMFEVKRIIKMSDEMKNIILKGIDVRIEADAPVDDLKIVSKEERKRKESELEKRIIIEVKKEEIKKDRKKERVYTGKILHLDGDKGYSEKSVMYYRKIGLNAIVKNIPENKQPKVVYRLLTIYNPEILVITRA